MKNEIKKRELSEIMDEFLNDITEENNRVILGEKAKANVKEIAEHYGWHDKRNAEYKAGIIEDAKKYNTDSITLCVKDMCEKIVDAPTTLHAIAVPKWIMPVLWEFIKEAEE